MKGISRVTASATRTRGAEIGALIIALYVAIRVATQFGRLAAVAPFEHRALKTTFAVGALLLLGCSFVVVAIFIERLALSVAG